MSTAPILVPQDRSHALDQRVILGDISHEFTLATLLARRGAKRAFLAGYEPPYSSISVELLGSAMYCFARAAPVLRRLVTTPLENRIEKLVSIVEFIAPFRLGPTFHLLDAHQMRDENGRVVGYRDLDRLGTTLAPVVIRRRKREVMAQLPERLEKTFFVPMTREQLVHHRENGEIVARIAAKWRRSRHLRSHSLNMTTFVPGPSKISPRSSPNGSPAPAGVTSCSTAASTAARAES